MTTQRLVLLAIVSASCAPPSPEPTALALEEEVRGIAEASARTDSLWPGFDPLAIPLAVYDGERTFLFRHPSPPGDFATLPEAEPSTHVLTGRHEAVTANTSAEIPTTTQP